MNNKTVFMVYSTESNYINLELCDPPQKKIKPSVVEWGGEKV